MSDLRRVLHVRGAAAIGIGAMLGTGVFAVWTPAFSLAGEGLLLALGLAAVVAALNAVSTASLARAVPRAGGVYAYGKEFVGRGAGVAAGYAFVIGKSASAGAAALTIGAYAWPGQERLIGVIAVVVALGLDLRGIVRSMRVTVVLIVVVVAIIAALAVSWWSSPVSGPASETAATTAWGVLGAAGLLFVAFAGYARITVLGEEVTDPRRTIPRAMFVSFAVVIVVYAVVALVVLGAVAAGVALTVAPLESIASATDRGGLAVAVRIAAILAAGAVLLSLIAGIGRTLFAMGRGGDAPRPLAALNGVQVPWRAELAAGLLALAVVAVGGIGFALGLSAVTILTYYGIAHLCVLARWRRGDIGGRLAAVAAVGLLGCLVVALGLVVVALHVEG
ncbi:MAG: APC family permease [Candidatus Nanopelagicales bacterium]